MDESPNDLTRSYDLTITPAEALKYIRGRLPDTSAISAPARIHRPTPAGFYLVQGRKKGWLTSDRGIHELVAGVRVTLTPDGDGTRVEVTWAGTLEVGIPYMFSGVTLFMAVGCVRVGWPDNVPMLIPLAMLAGHLAYVHHHHRRERVARFAGLAERLEAVLQPLRRAEVRPPTTTAGPTVIRPLRQPGTVEVTLAGLVHALTEAGTGQEPPAHLVQLDPDAAALALHPDHALVVLLRHDPARATAEQIDARLAAVLRSERPEVLAGLSTGPVLAAMLGDVAATAVAAAPAFSRALGRPVQWCVIATDGLVERVGGPAADVLRRAAMTARRRSAPTLETFAALERRGEERVGAAGAELLFGAATDRLRRAPATLAIVVALAAIFTLQAAWFGRQDADELLRLGGMQQERALAGEWWRALSSGLLHSDTRHLGGNISAMLVGYFVELVIGTSRYLVLFTASVLAGSLLAAAVSPPGVVLIGASSGVFGLTAALLVLTWRDRRLLPGKHGARLRRATLLLLGLNFLLSLLPGVSLAAHLGGALMGAVLAGSGALTWRQPRAWMDERAHPGVAWLARGLACACVLASALALALAWSHGRPWAP